MHETWPVYRVNLYWDIIYASVVYCDIVIHKLISYCMLDSSCISCYCCCFSFFFIAFLHFSVQNLYWDLCYIVWIHHFHIRPIVHIVYQPKFGSAIPSISFWVLQSSQGKLKSKSWEVNGVIWPKWKRWINTNY